MFTTKSSDMRLRHGLKVLYWSCIVRNTLVSFFLRRPARLHQIQAELIQPDDLLEYPNHEAESAELETRRFQMHAFVWTCKICEILNIALSSLARVTLFSNGFIKETGAYDDTDAEERFRFQAFNAHSLQLLEVQKFEADLVQLNSAYNKALGTFESGTFGLTTKDSGPCHMNRMITL